MIKLYNRKNSEQLSISEKPIDDFKDLFPNFNKFTDPNKAIIGSVSITQKRKESYDFSYSYLPARIAILGLKSKNISIIDNLKLGFVKGTIQEKIAYDLSKKKNVQLKTYANMDEIIRGVIVGDVDLVLLENVSAWSDSRLTVVKDLINNESDGYGIVFSKNSSLKKKLDPFLRYYLKSQAFYKSCREIYGEEIALYYKKNLI